MTNSLAIFDWEWTVVCKHYGQALAVQNYLLKESNGNLPVPSAFDLAAKFQYDHLYDHPSRRVNEGMVLALSQAENALEQVTRQSVSLLFGGISEIERVRCVLESNDTLDAPCSELVNITPCWKSELLPQTHNGSIDMADFTPNQILQWSEALLRSNDDPRSIKLSLAREEAMYSTGESEPVYPWVIEEIQRLKDAGYTLALVHKCDRLTTETQRRVAALFDYHEQCGLGTSIHKPNPVILRNCIRTIGDRIKMRINDLIGSTFYICSGYTDLKMALTTQAHGRSVWSIHCLYSADDHRFSERAALANAFLDMIRIHPQRVADEKNPGESRREALDRLQRKYCYQNLSFADHPSAISDAISDLQSRRADNQNVPLEIAYENEK